MDVHDCTTTRAATTIFRDRNLVSNSIAVDRTTFQGGRETEPKYLKTEPKYLETEPKYLETATASWRSNNKEFLCSLNNKELLCCTNNKLLCGPNDNREPIDIFVVRTTQNSLLFKHQRALYCSTPASQKPASCPCLARSGRGCTSRAVPG